MYFPSQVRGWILYANAFPWPLRSTFVAGQTDDYSKFHGVAINYSCSLADAVNECIRMKIKRRKVEGKRSRAV